MLMIYYCEKHNTKMCMHYNLNFHLKYMYTRLYVEERMEENMLEIFITGW